MGTAPAPYELPDERVQEAWQRLIGEYLIVEELEPALAARLSQAGVKSVAELGSAAGPISRLLSPQGVSCLALDMNPPPNAFSPMVCGDLRALPFADNSFDAVTAMNCLYFLEDPTQGVREARRVLAADGLFLAGAPSRNHDPELRHVLPDWGQRSPFDAEDAAEIVATSFRNIEAEWWEVPAYHLPNQQAVIDYLVAFKIPDAESRAAEVPTPTHITKSGVNVWARP